MFITINIISENLFIKSASLTTNIVTYLNYKI